MAHDWRQPVFDKSPTLGRVAQAAIGGGLKAQYEVSEALPSLFYALIARIDEVDARKVTSRYGSKGPAATKGTEAMTVDVRHRGEKEAKP